MKKLFALLAFTLMLSGYAMALDQRSLGNASNYFNQLTYSVSGTIATDMGRARSYAYGDFNSDGITDLAVGFPSNNSGSSFNTGSVDIYYGSKTLGLSTAGILTPNVTISHFNDGATNYAWGRSIASGDFNNDSYDDLAVGEAGVRRVAVIYGGVSSMLANQTVHQIDDLDFRLAYYDGQGAGAGSPDVGSKIAMGDVNGDGITDLLIGVGNTVLTDFNSGRVYVAYGGATTPVAGDRLFLVDMNNTNVRFDMNLTAGGTTILFGGSGQNGEMFVEDINGDGFGDIFFSLAASARWVSNGGIAMAVKGGAFSNQNISVNEEANLLFQLTTTTASLIGGSSRYADVNGDGLKDLLVACRGAAGTGCGTLGAGAILVYYAPLPSDGRNLTMADANLTIQGEIAADSMDEMVITDVNGDYIPDLVIGANNNDFAASNAGQTYVVLLPTLMTGTVGVATAANYSFYGTTINDNAGITLIGGSYISETANFVMVTRNTGVSTNGYFFIINPTINAIAPKVVTTLDNATTPSAGQAVAIKAYALENFNLSTAILEFNGVNTTMGLTGIESWANFTKAAAAGVNTYRFYITDDSGNMKSSGQGTFNATASDTTAPTFTLQQPTNGVQYAGGSPVTISAFWTDDVALASFIFESNVTGSLANTTVTASGASNFSNYTFPALADGAYKWRVYATDSSGNMNATPQRDFSLLTAVVQQSRYQNINLGEGVGSTTGFFIKGVAQIGAKTFDNMLSDSMALISLLVAGLLLVGIGFALTNGEKAVKMLDGIL